MFADEDQELLHNDGQETNEDEDSLPPELDFLKDETPKSGREVMQDLSESYKQTYDTRPARKVRDTFRLILAIVVLSIFGIKYVIDTYFMN